MPVDIGNGVLFYRRAEWNARSPRSVSGLNPTFGSTSHWEGPHMGDFPHSQCAGKVKAIQNFHMDSRGWSDIAYTGVVCPHGCVFEGRWVGVRTAANGTTAGNNQAYALCYLGGENDGFTSDGEVAMRTVQDWLDIHGSAGPGRNCHSDWKATACPGPEICPWVKAGQPVDLEEDVAITPEEFNEIERRSKLGARAALGEGTGLGQVDWPSTSRATLAQGQELENRDDVNKVKLDSIEAKVDTIAIGGIDIEALAAALAPKLEPVIREVVDSELDNRTLATPD